MRQGQEIPESLQTYIGIGAAVETGEANASIGPNTVWEHGVSDFEGVCSGDRDGERNLGIAVERVQHVRHSPAPARARWLIRDGGLPLHRLVGMREELRRNGRPAEEVLGASDGRDERAHIRDDPEVALIKKGLQFRQARMETEVTAVAVLQSEWKKRRLRERENASRSGVGGVSVRIVRDDYVVRIVSAEKEKAHERLVVAAVGNGGRTQSSEIEDRVEQAGGRERGASSLANEGAAGRCVHNY